MQYYVVTLRRESFPGDLAAFADGDLTKTIYQAFADTLGGEPYIWWDEEMDGDEVTLLVNATEAQLDPGVFIDGENFSLTVEELS